MQQTDRFGNGTTDDRPPSSELEIYQDVIDPVEGDRFLERTNIGLGNYDKNLFWMQICSYRWGMYGDAAFGRRLVNRAIYETKRELGKTGWHWYNENENKAVVERGWEGLDEDEQAERSRREYIEKRGRELWRKLPDKEQQAALMDITGITDDWRPPHWRLLAMRHEGSRSLGARLLDNIFGRTTRIETEGDDALRQLDDLGRGGGRGKK